MADTPRRSPLDGIPSWTFEVVATFPLTPRMQRVQITADNIDTLAFQPGQDFMLTIPVEGTKGTRRRYTIRRFDRGTGVVDLDMVLHGHGPGATWAVNAKPGDHLHALGPRGNITLNAEADWLLFFGDESALPATAAMIEAAPAGTKAFVFLEVIDDFDQQAVDIPADADVTWTWLHRGDTEPGTSTVLVDALKNFALPFGTGQSYLNGELAVMNQLRELLVAKGQPADHIALKSYWRRGVANAAHGEPLRDGQVLPANL